MGVVVGTYAKYEHATRAPDAVNLIRLHKMTNVDLNWLLTGFESATGPLDFDILKGVIQAIEEETLGIDPVSKARLISRLYSDRIKEKSVGIEANIPSRGKQAT